MKKKAFTLAEILITFAIIGGIAALGITTLKNAIWTQQRNTGLKTVYTKLNDAWALAIQDLDYTPKCAYWGPGKGANPYTFNNIVTKTDAAGNKSWWYTDSDGQQKRLPDVANGDFSQCKEFGDAIIERLEVAKFCSSQALRNGCIPKYKGNDEVAKWNGASGRDVITQTSGTSGFRTNNMNNLNHAFVLRDGTIIIGYMSTAYFHPRIFAVDINGYKGPNEWGYDLFALQSKLGYDGKKINIKGWSMPVKQGGVQVEDILSGNK